MKKNKIYFIEEGRINNTELDEIKAGALSNDCMDASCSIFSGSGYLKQKNCVHMYLQCDFKYGNCLSETSYSYCGTSFKGSVPV